jgi:hypothetical protein
VGATPWRFKSSLAHPARSEAPDLDGVLMLGAVAHLEIAWEDPKASGIEFEDRGGYQLKGVPGEWRVFAVASSTRV